jgi:hypothetical protein
MSETKTVRVHDHVADGVEHEAAHRTSMVAAVVYYVVGIVALLLGVRFLFQLLGANNVGIVTFVYQVTEPFVAPFYGSLGNTVLYGNARIEWESLFAIIAVAIIGYIVAGFVRVISR